MKEEQIHFDAFETYFEYKQNQLSTNKSINLVSEKYDYSVRTIWKWYKKFDWKKREKQRRQEINDIMARKHNQEIAKNKSNYLKIGHEILNQFINDSLPAQIENVKDLETIVKLCLLLQEEATEISKGEQVNVDLTEQVNKLFDEDKMKKILLEEKIISTEEGDE